MSVTSIHQCKNLSAMIRYCVTPKKEQKGDRVACMYSDFGNSDIFLKYGIETAKTHKRKVQAFTLLQSFPQHEFDVNNAEHISCVNELGRKLAYELYPNSPCLVITHADSVGKCLHNHIAIINHDLSTNGCIKENRHFRYVRQANDKLMQKYGLEICQPTEQKQTQREYWTNKRNHWMDDLKEKVGRALSRSTSLQEFQENLLTDGISTAFYKANGALKEHFTFVMVDNDGKEHKKRSEKLGEEYTRKAIEDTLLENKKQKELNTIMPMSEWIEIQKEKAKTAEALPIPNIPVITKEKCDEISSDTENNVIAERSTKMQSKEKTKTNLKATTNDGKTSLELLREQKYQKAKEELVKIEKQINLIRLKYDEGTDTEKDDEELERLYRRRIDVTVEAFSLSKQISKEEAVLDESLDPTVQSYDKEMEFSI